MEEYRSNSHKSRENTKEKKVEKVVSGEVKTKKKNEIRKFTDLIISDDVDNVKSYILMDILIPSFKKAISDIVTNGIDILLYGETGKTRRNGNQSRASYERYYDRNDHREYRASRSINRYDYDDIIFDNRGEAERVLDCMYDLLDQYRLVSVADLFDLAGIDHNNYTDNDYGWDNLQSAKIMRIRDGWKIKLPKAMPIK